MRLTEKTARSYLTDDAVRAMARNSALQLAHERPGTDPLDLNPTHTIPLALAGRTITGLAVAADLALADTSISSPHDIAEGARQALALISLWGASLDQHPADDHLATHEALLHRTIRELDKAAARLAEGTVPPDGGDPAAITRALQRNIDDLRAEF